MFRTTHKREELDKKSGVYKITLRGTNRHYVGATRSLWMRLKKHIYTAHSAHAKKYQPIHLAIQDYGADAFDFAVLAFCDPGALGDLELHFMHQFDAVESGFNEIYHGRPRQIGATPPTQETKDKISVANKGRKRSEGCRKAIGEANKTRPPLTEEQKANRLWQWRKAGLAGGALKKRPVEQYDKNGNFIMRYESITEACKATGMKSVGNVMSHIAGTSRGKYCKGFIWKYAAALVN